MLSLDGKLKENNTHLCSQHALPESGDVCMAVIPHSAHVLSQVYVCHLVVGPLPKLPGQVIVTGQNTKRGPVQDNINTNLFSLLE